MNCYIQPKLIDLVLTIHDKQLLDAEKKQFIGKEKPLELLFNLIENFQEPHDENYKELFEYVDELQSLMMGMLIIGKRSAEFCNILVAILLSMALTSVFQE